MIQLYIVDYFDLFKSSGLATYVSQLTKVLLIKNKQSRKISFMTKRSILLILAICCIDIFATGQSPYRIIRLIPKGGGNFNAIEIVDSLSTADRLNKKLDVVSASFYQISDSLLTSPDAGLARDPFQGTLWNAFSNKNQFSMSYSITPINIHGASDHFYGKTNRPLSIVDSIDVARRDSLIRDRHKRTIALRLTQNVLPNGVSCISKEQQIMHTNYDKEILNADSVTVIQYVSPYHGTCAAGLSKDVILYKKDVGYIVLYYSMFRDWRRKITFQEASDLLDEAIRQTWGIIRFDKE